MHETVIDPFGAKPRIYLSGNRILKLKTTPAEQACWLLVESKLGRMVPRAVTVAEACALVPEQRYWIIERTGFEISALLAEAGFCKDPSLSQALTLRAADLNLEIEAERYGGEAPADLVEGRDALASFFAGVEQEQAPVDAPLTATVTVGAETISLVQGVDETKVIDLMATSAGGELLIQRGATVLSRLEWPGGVNTISLRVRGEQLSVRVCYADQTVTSFAVGD